MGFASLPDRLDLLARHAERDPVGTYTGSVSSFVEVRLEPACHLGGRVLAPDGNAVANVVVTLTTRSGHIDETRYTLSDEDGRYEFSGLLGTAEFELMSYPPRESDTWRTRRQEWVGFGSARRLERDIQFREPMEIRGRVLDQESGEPLRGIGVTLRGDLCVGSSSDRDGRFRFLVADDVGTYRIVVEASSLRELAATDVEVQPGAGLSELEFRVPRPSVLRVRLLSGGTAHVPPGALWIDHREGSDVEIHRALEFNPDGWATYSLSAEPFRVRAELPPAEDGTVHWGESEWIEPKAGETVEVTVELDQVRYPTKP